MAAVPASLGGMIAMNFGCWDNEMATIISYIDVYIPQQGIQRLHSHECNFGYRSSIFQTKPWIILQAGLHVTPSQKNTVTQTVKSYVQQRCNKQPMRAKTFGSIFENPKNHTAALLIEQAGLKGFKLNQAKISDHHANFMENTDNCSAEEALELIQHVQHHVQKNNNITLKPEVHIFDDPRT